jgi:hypothetical protein
VGVEHALGKPVEPMKRIFATASQETAREHPRILRSPFDVSAPKGTVSGAPSTLIQGGCQFGNRARRGKVARALNENKIRAQRFRYIFVEPGCRASACSLAI